MMFVRLVTDKPRGEVGWLAARVTGPNGQRLGEIDIEHDVAEIEQQRVGGVGGERGVHIRRSTKPDKTGQRPIDAGDQPLSRRRYRLIPA
jgi:hypothetical protein